MVVKDASLATVESKAKREVFKFVPALAVTVPVTSAVIVPDGFTLTGTYPPPPPVVSPYSNEFVRRPKSALVGVVPKV